MDNLDFTRRGFQEKYKSLSVCVIDCVYSLRSKYYSITIPVVERYASKYMGGNRFAPNDNLTDLLSRMESFENPEEFANSVLNNKQKLSRRSKADVCYELANKLNRLLSINTFEDFQKYEKPELLEIVLRSVKGFGDAGVNYMFMLAGDSDRCKPDVHIHNCIKDAIGRDVSNSECQEIFKCAVKELDSHFKGITVRDLDYLVWDKYQSKKRNAK